jgi:hypothetical protein
MMTDDRLLWYPRLGEGVVVVVSNKLYAIPRHFTSLTKEFA